MRAKDQLKLEVICKVSSGHMSRFDGQKILCVSERTLRRYLKQYEDNGIAFIRHGNCLGSPPNKTPDEFKKKVFTNFNSMQNRKTLDAERKPSFRISVDEELHA